MKKFFLTIVALINISAIATAQLKVGSNPTIITPNSNIEIEATNGKKVRVGKDAGTMIIENVPAASSTDSVMLQHPYGEIHRMSIARFAAMMKANGVGLPAGGTTGQVLTQNATGIPTWQSPEMSKTITDFPIDNTNNVIDISALKVGQCWSPGYNYKDQTLYAIYAGLGKEFLFYLRDYYDTSFSFNTRPLTRSTDDGPYINVFHYGQRGFQTAAEAKFFFYSIDKYKVYDATYGSPADDMKLIVAGPYSFGIYKGSGLMTQSASWFIQKDIGFCRVR